MIGHDQVQAQVMVRLGQGHNQVVGLSPALGILSLLLSPSAPSQLMLSCSQNKFINLKKKKEWTKDEPNE